MTELLKLTKNEKKVLIELASQGRITDTKLAETISMTQQAVYQIRTRLESLGVIEGYAPVVNFKKIGLDVVYVIGINILPETWVQFKEHEINKKLLDMPFLIRLIRVPSQNISYIAILCFKNIEEREKFSSRFEAQLSKWMNVEWSYTTFIDNLLAQDKLSIVSYAINDKEIDFNKVIEKLVK